MLSVLCRPGDRDAMARQILRLTGSFGVRYHEWDRLVLDRRFVEADTPLGLVTVKVGELDGETLTARPEFESVRRLAAAAGVTPRQAMDQAVAAATALARGAR